MLEVEVSGVMYVTVSAETIREGRPTEDGNPIALALNWQHPVLHASWVTSLKWAWLRDKYDNVSTRVPLPERAVTFLRCYKRGQREFRPLQFQLNANRAELARKMPRRTA